MHEFIKSNITYRYFLFDDFLCDIVNFRSFQQLFIKKFKIIYCDWWNITTWYKINFTAWLLLKNSSVVNCFDGFEIKFWFDSNLHFFYFGIFQSIETYMYQTISTALVNHLDWSSSELNFWSLSVRVEEKTLNFY